MTSFAVENLADHVGLIPEIARLLDEEFHRFRSNRSLERRIAELQEAANDATKLPMCFVVLLEGSIAGVVRLVEHDHPDMLHLSPWLASLFTLPQYRNRGVSRRLIHRVVEETRSQGFPRLYLFTDNANELYRRIGWQAIGKSRVNKIEVEVMELMIQQITVRGTPPVSGRPVV